MAVRLTNWNAVLILMKLLGWGGVTNVRATPSSNTCFMLQQRHVIARCNQRASSSSSTNQSHGRTRAMHNKKKYNA